jgi:hypothetical protein
MSDIGIHDRHAEDRYRSHRRQWRPRALGDFERTPGQQEARGHAAGISHEHRRPAAPGSGEIEQEEADHGSDPDQQKRGSAARPRRDRHGRASAEGDQRHAAGQTVHASIMLTAPMTFTRQNTVNQAATDPRYRSPVPAIFAHSLDHMVTPPHCDRGRQDLHGELPGRRHSPTVVQRSGTSRRPALRHKRRYRGKG